MELLTTGALLLLHWPAATAETMQAAVPSSGNWSDDITIGSAQGCGTELLVEKCLQPGRASTVPRTLNFPVTGNVCHIGLRVDENDAFGPEWRAC